MNRQSPDKRVIAPGKPLVVLLLGPHRAAVSGVSTHLNMLMESDLAKAFSFRHFQVGSEGRRENALSRWLRLVASPFALAARLCVGRVDVVHINTSLNRRAYWRDLIYLLVARICGVRVLYQIHGGDLPEQFAQHNRLLKFLLRCSFRLPERIVVLARDEHDAYREFTQRPHISLLPNAINCAPYLHLARRPRDDQQELRLIYIGRLSRQKGLFDALKGLRMARAGGAQASFLIAGSGPDDAALRHAVVQLNLSGAVKFADPVFGDDKIRMMGEADVLLFPSYAEGLPYALLEGMAAGLAVIATRVGAIPDVLLEDCHGLFVGLRDAPAIAQAITRLDSDRSLVAQMGTACRQRIASDYSIQRWVAQFSELYVEVGAR